MIAEVSRSVVQPLSWQLTFRWVASGTGAWQTRKRLLKRDDVSAWQVPPAASLFHGRLHIRRPTVGDIVTDILKIPLRHTIAHNNFGCCFNLLK